MNNKQIKDLSRQFSDVERDLIKEFVNETNFLISNSHDSKRSEVLRLSNEFYLIEIKVTLHNDKRVITVSEISKSGLDFFICENASELDKYFKTLKN